MKRIAIVGVLVLVVSLVLPGAALADGPSAWDYGDVTLSGGFQSGHFEQLWDLTACDLVISFTYDATGLVDGAGAHAWAELGVREEGYGDFNPTWMAGGAGVWLATDYDWGVGTFDPDPVGSPTQDLDDKLILQKGGGMGESAYNLPSVPPSAGANHRFWFDRDGVDPWQAMNPLAVDGGTYNTGGTYDIVITLHATDATTGTAYMSINGLDQGFETDGNWKTMELSPAGMTFTGDMTRMQVFYGLYGYGATHGVAFDDIEVEGCLAELAVSLDIKPGSDPNSINLKSKGVVPVAILTTDEFDAAMVDPIEVEFAGASPVRWSLQDVDDDGDLDLVLHFKTQELDLEASSIEAVLTGETFGGNPIVGSDSVNITPKGPKV